MAVEHWLQLALTPGLGPILIGRLVEAAGSAAAAAGASVELLQAVEGIGTTRAKSIHPAMKQSEAEAEKQLVMAQRLGCRVLCQEDAAYPRLMRSLGDRPPVLFVHGTLEDRDLQALAIVGSRRCSHYGREQAERFAGLLAGAGFTVVSGGARGVDSAAHRGAMMHPHGRTIAVLGCGADVTYPPENQSLFAQIRERGALVSEFPLGMPPSAENFPRRNRVISGLSRGVLVVEADIRSGALITARQANEDHGRPVFAIPGRVDNPLSQGPHQLIRDGATLVTSLEQIMDGLDPLPFDVFEAAAVEAPLFSDREMVKPQIVPSQAGLSAEAQLLLSHMDGSPATIDQLIDRTGLTAAVVLRELTFLTLRGQVRRVDGQTFELRRQGSRE